MLDWHHKVGGVRINCVDCYFKGSFVTKMIGGQNAGDAEILAEPLRPAYLTESMKLISIRIQTTDRG